MKRPDQSKARFRVGDWVRFDYVTCRMTAQIIEDRGRIGYKGRRLSRLRMERDANDTIEFEMPEVEIEPADAPVSPPK
jgi:hypothetical protein